MTAKWGETHRITKPVCRHSDCMLKPKEGSRYCVMHAQQDEKKSAVPYSTFISPIPEDMLKAGKSFPRRRHLIQAM